MSDSNSVKTGGISGATLLGILFIGLKLTGHIDWSWVWVLAPFWVGLAVFVGIIALIAAGGLLWMILGGIVAGLESLGGRARRPKKKKNDKKR